MVKQTMFELWFKFLIIGLGILALVFLLANLYWGNIFTLTEPTSFYNRCAEHAGVVYQGHLWSLIRRLVCRLGFEARRQGYFQASVALFHEAPGPGLWARCWDWPY